MYRVKGAYNTNTGVDFLGRCLSCGHKVKNTGGCLNPSCPNKTNIKEGSAMTEQLDRAYSVLELYGVPKERARSVANGIEVLVTRCNRQIQDLKFSNTALKDALREAVSKLNHLINKSNRVTAKGRSTIADSIDYNSDINMLYGAQCEAEAFIKKLEEILK